MKPIVPMNMFARRDLLKAGGALLIGVTIGGAARAQETEGVAVALGPDQPDPKSLDTWIAIHADNTATIFIGYLAGPQPFPEHGRGHDERVLGQQRVAVAVVDLLQPVQ